MKSTIIVPPDGSVPPRMPVGGAVIAEALDSLGWSIWLLDVAAYGMTAEAVRVETEKENPDLVVFISNRNQYRFAKQYIPSIRKALPHSLLVASTDLKPKHLREWLPELDFAMSGYPTRIIMQLSGRTETQNTEHIPDSDYEQECKLPHYHPLTCHFEQHARLRGMRMADVPVRLFGATVPATNAVETVGELRMKYAIHGFHLLGSAEPTWLPAFMKGLEEKELVGSPANITWTCEIVNPKDLTNPLLRELVGHGCRVITTHWGQMKELERVIETATGLQAQVILQLSFGDRKPYEYFDMAEFLSAHDLLPVAAKFTENPDRYDDEAYVANLTNGMYLPHGMNLHADMELLALRDCVLSRDVERVKKWMKQK